MKISRDEHFLFLERELKAEIQKFDEDFKSRAEFLLNGPQKKMFVGQFLAFKDSGDMIVRFPISRITPRKSIRLLCMVLPEKLRNYQNWGDMTYEDLYKERAKSTECDCVWDWTSDDRKFTLVGFRGIDKDFKNFIQEYPFLILVFAPEFPPLEYLGNLQRIVTNTLCPEINEVLDIDFFKQKWNPILLRQDVADFVYQQWTVSDTLIIQGPPGTGKTYMIAEICARLCSEGKSVMITALTNRALMEVADKPALAPYLKKGKVFKTSLTNDEQKETPSLQCAEVIVAEKGCLILSTFYTSSGFAAELEGQPPFDYVIMDEASQAFFAMFAAAKRIGKKNLWVGDTNQLAPIYTLNNDIANKYHYNELIHGFQTACESMRIQTYQLASTWRFSQRAADYTGLFYHGTLQSTKGGVVNVMTPILNLIHESGGPSLVLTDMPMGDYAPKFCAQLIISLIHALHSFDRKLEVAVLAVFVNTVQKLFAFARQTIGVHHNELIETVARVQGLTVDVTIFFIPNTSVYRSLEKHLFNVATSRAREHTIIIADRHILSNKEMDAEVYSFLTKLKKERSIFIPEQAVNSGLLDFTSGT